LLGVLELFLLLVGGAFIEDGDVADVGASFGEGRNAAVPGDHVGTGVVGGESEREIAVVLAEKIFEVVRAGVDILGGIENIGDLIFGSRRGDELHEAARLFAGDGVNIEIRFDGDDAADEVGVDAMFFSGVVNQGIERGRAGGKRLLVGREHVFGVDGENVGLGDGESAARHCEDEVRAVVSVAGDVEALAGAEHGVVCASESRGRGAEECERGEARNILQAVMKARHVIRGDMLPGNVRFNYLVSIVGHLEFGCERRYLVG
jgi:hypothetical protein